ncbi:MAG: hypothetical protein HY547_01385 [Elusimicrobia bacterium]|nr:hypothetical protein [Elusimicrobiota bacterium]
MFAYFRGIVSKVTWPQKKGEIAEIWLEVSGVGYRVQSALATAKRLVQDDEATLYLSQSAALYGGETTLYGFLSDDERRLFELLRVMPGIGAKKAVDYFDKIMEVSPQNFLQGLSRGDEKMLCAYFGFAPKTAAKMISSLKEKAQPLLLSYAAKHSSMLTGGAEVSINSANAGLWQQAREALIALGFDGRRVENALSVVVTQESSDLKLEQIVRRVLRELSAGASVS